MRARGWHVTDVKLAGGRTCDAASGEEGSKDGPGRKKWSPSVEQVHEGFPGCTVDGVMLRAGSEYEDPELRWIDGMDLCISARKD